MLEIYAANVENRINTKRTDKTQSNQAIENSFIASNREVWKALSGEIITAQANLGYALSFLQGKKGYQEKEIKDETEEVLSFISKIEKLLKEDNGR